MCVLDIPSDIFGNMLTESSNLKSTRITRAVITKKVETNLKLKQFKLVYMCFQLISFTLEFS